jgi:PhzF family phenazine biosynthesis protein
MEIGMKIWTVDAFASEPYTGNPAAVTIVQDFPNDELCKKIAAEMNLSETAFVKPLQDGTFHIRWFTPTVEVKLCGHATLAAAHILFQEGMAANQVHLISLSGPLSVLKEAGSMTLNFPLQKTGPNLSADGFIELLDLDQPVISVVQAYDDIIIEMENAQDVRELCLDPKDVHKIDCRALIVTAKGDDHYDFISRFFGPRVGVNEDPVTGSAHCKLAHYWQQKLNKNTFLAYQASERGGEIQISIKGDRVLLTGKAVTILEGNWLV